MLDTGCSRMVAAMYWYVRLKNKLKQFGLRTIEFPDTESYRFGPGPVTHSKCAALVPVGLRGYAFIFRISIVEGDIPLLVSHPAMSELDLSYHARSRTAYVGVVDAPLQAIMLTESRPMIDLLDYGPRGFQGRFDLEHSLMEVRRSLDGYAKEVPVPVPRLGSQPVQEQLPERKSLSSRSTSTCSSSSTHRTFTSSNSMSRTSCQTCGSHPSNVSPELFCACEAACPRVGLFSIGSRPTSSSATSTPDSNGADYNLGTATPSCGASLLASSGAQGYAPDGFAVGAVDACSTRSRVDECTAKPQAGRRTSGRDRGRPGGACGVELVADADDVARPECDIEGTEARQPYVQRRAAGGTSNVRCGHVGSGTSAQTAVGRDGEAGATSTRRGSGSLEELGQEISCGTSTAVHRTERALRGSDLRSDASSLEGLDSPSFAERNPDGYNIGQATSAGHGGIDFYECTGSTDATESGRSPPRHVTEHGDAFLEVPVSQCKHDYQEEQGRQQSLLGEPNLPTVPSDDASGSGRVEGARQPDVGIVGLNGANATDTDGSRDVHTGSKPEPRRRVREAGSHAGRSGTAAPATPDGDSECPAGICESTGRPPGSAGGSRPGSSGSPGAATGRGSGDSDNRGSGSEPVCVSEAAGGSAHDDADGSGRGGPASPSGAGVDAAALLHMQEFRPRSARTMQQCWRAADMVVERSQSRISDQRRRTTERGGRI